VLLYCALRGASMRVRFCCAPLYCVCCAVFPLGESMLSLFCCASPVIYSLTGTGGRGPSVSFSH